MKALVAAAALLLASLPASARTPELEHPETAECIGIAAERFAVSETALWLILDVEGGTVGRVSQNTNGTVDIGPMQINSWWAHPNRLGRFGITYDDLLHNRCLNIYAAAWIFAQEYQREGDLVRAIARYHSPTPHLQHRYLGLIQQAIQRRARRVASHSQAPPQNKAPLPVIAQSKPIPLQEASPQSVPKPIAAPTIIAARNTLRSAQ